MITIVYSAPNPSNWYVAATNPPITNWYGAVPTNIIVSAATKRVSDALRSLAAVALNGQSFSCKATAFYSFEDPATSTGVISVSSLKAKNCVALN